MSPSAYDGTAAGVRSTSMPTEQVSEPAPVSAASVDAQLLELFFDRVPMGVAIFGTDMRLQRCNKTWTSFYEHYLGVTAEFTAPGVHAYDLMPGNEAAIDQLFGQALAGRLVRQAAHPISIPGLETYWDVVFAPLFEDGRIVGVVDIVTDATDRVLGFQRLEGRIRAFTEIAEAMTVDQRLDEMLERLVGVVRAAIGVPACSAVLFDIPGDEVVRLFSAAGLPAGYGEAVAAAWQAGVHSPVREATSAGKISTVRGFRQQALDDPGYSGLHPFLSHADWEDVTIVPLDTQGLVVGSLNVHLEAGRALDEDDVGFLQAVSGLAAVAVQNARLLAETAANAGVLERQRLARELHDSVSQALFSTTLHARAAERHAEAAGLDPNGPVATEIGRLRALTQGALAEMRALIFELRPGALAEEGLAAALAKQAAALASREQVCVQVQAPQARLPLSAPVEEHLYRIALEALHNAVKHSGSDRFELVLGLADGVVSLLVCDDGSGFDPSVPRPGHLGMQSMAERARAIGAQLRVDSAPATGTRVSVTLPVEPS